MFFLEDMQKGIRSFVYALSQVCETNGTKEKQSNRTKIKSSIQPYIGKIAKIFGNHKANSKLDHVHLGFISNRYNESF